MQSGETSALVTEYDLSLSLSLPVYRKRKMKTKSRNSIFSVEFKVHISAVNICIRQMRCSCALQTRTHNPHAEGIGLNNNNYNILAMRKCIVPHTGTYSIPCSKIERRTNRTQNECLRATGWKCEESAVEKIVWLKKQSPRMMMEDTHTVCKWLYGLPSSATNQEPTRLPSAVTKMGFCYIASEISLEFH